MLLLLGFCCVKVLQVSRLCFLVKFVRNFNAFEFIHQGMYLFAGGGYFNGI